MILYAHAAYLGGISVDNGPCLMSYGLCMPIRAGCSSLHTQHTHTHTQKKKKKKKAQNISHTFYTNQLHFSDLAPYGSTSRLYECQTRAQTFLPPVLTLKRPDIHSNHT